jgi:hypothetical protein
MKEAPDWGGLSAGFAPDSRYGWALRNWGEELPMRAFTYVAIALIAAAMSVPPIGAAFAQAGSTGGTVGNQDKSISGGEGEIRHHAVRKPPRRREPAATLGSFDGNWAGISVGTCIGQFGWKLQVSTGVISGNGTTGQIVRSGATNGDMVVMGKHFLFKGVTRTSGKASGTWTSSPNCSGSWTAIRS